MIKQIKINSLLITISFLQITHIKFVNILITITYLVIRCFSSKYILIINYN